MVEEVPAFVEVVGPLVQLCGLLVALAAIVLIKDTISGLLNGIASLFSFLPGVGSVTASAAHGVEAVISRGLSRAIAGIESQIGKQWHAFARVLGMLWAEQKLVAENLWHLAQSLYHAVPLSDLNKLIHRLDGRIQHLTRTITRDVTREVHKTVTRVEALGNHVLPRIRRLEHAVDHTLPRELTGLWGQTKALEDSLGRLWDRVRSLPGAGDITAAVATAIAALGLVGLDLLRCGESKNVADTRGCSMWNALDDLLGLLALGIAAENFDTLVHEAQDLTEGAVTVFDDVFGISR